MSLLQETASFQEHVPVTKKSSWANDRRRRRRRRVSIVCRISDFRGPDSEYRMICDFISTRTAHAIILKVDTGSQVNIMPLKELKKIQGNDPTWRYATTNWLATREIISQY